MNKHSIQSKILVFCGVAMLLGACSSGYTVEEKLEVPTVKVSSQTLAVEENQQSREDYLEIDLSRFGSVTKLQGSDPKAIALRLFGNTEPESGSESGKSEISVETNYPRAVTILTQTGIADDSVNSIRYRAEFTAATNTVPSEQAWTLVWAGSQFKCQQGRGHQDWSSKLCS